VSDYKHQFEVARTHTRMCTYTCARMHICAHTRALFALLNYSFLHIFDFCLLKQYPWKL